MENFTILHNKVTKLNYLKFTTLKKGVQWLVIHLHMAAQNMGKKIYEQKDQPEHGISRENILHIVNFELLNASERASYQTNLFSPRVIVS